MKKIKESFTGGARNYLDGLKIRAKDDTKLLNNLYSITIIGNMLDWSCNFKVTEKLKKCLIDLLKRILTTQDGFCYLPFDDGYGNVNIPQTIYDFNKLDDYFITVDESDFSIYGEDFEPPYLDMDKNVMHATIGSDFVLIIKSDKTIKDFSKIRVIVGGKEVAIKYDTYNGMEFHFILNTEFISEILIGELQKVEIYLDDIRVDDNKTYIMRDE